MTLEQARTEALKHSPVNNNQLSVGRFFTEPEDQGRRAADLAPIEALRYE